MAAALRAAGWVDFFAPLWLLVLLALPVPALIAVRGRSGLPPRTNTVSLVTRTVLFVLLVLCLSDIQSVRESDGTCVLYLLDHSASIPPYIVEQELDYVVDSANLLEEEVVGDIIDRAFLRGVALIVVFFIVLTIYRWLMRWVAPDRGPNRTHDE